jgi:hypothetical protein
MMTDKDILPTRFATINLQHHNAPSVVTDTTDAYPHNTTTTPLDLQTPVGDLVGDVAIAPDTSSYEPALDLMRMRVNFPSVPVLPVTSKSFVFTVAQNCSVSIAVPNDYKLMRVLASGMIMSSGLPTIKSVSGDYFVQESDYDGSFYHAINSPIFLYVDGLSSLYFTNLASSGTLAIAFFKV